MLVDESGINNPGVVGGLESPLSTALPMATNLINGGEALLASQRGFFANGCL